MQFFSFQKSAAAKALPPLGFVLPKFLKAIRSEVAQVFISNGFSATPKHRKPFCKLPLPVIVWGGGDEMAAHSTEADPAGAANAFNGAATAPQAEDREVFSSLKMLYGGGERTFPKSLFQEHVYARKEFLYKELPLPEPQPQRFQNGVKEPRRRMVRLLLLRLRGHHWLLLFHVEGEIIARLSLLYSSAR